ncbi:hypothetical protein [Mycobacterium sp.]|uniref:hypothetical protein n=1 Tax=Mycobacterium sp. TaxID=1785 RepID=UPI0039C99583
MSNSPALLPIACRLPNRILAEVDSAYARDLELILTGVIFGFLARFTRGEIDVTEIVPGLELAVVQ